MQIKVCGMTQMEQVKQLDEMGVAYIGFIFYPASKRFVLTKNTLQDIADLQLTQAKKVGVFVNEPLTSILDIIKTAQLDMVQLHGDETVAYCDTLEGAIESACWFWNTHNLNVLADDNDVTGSTKVINGGTLGLDDRKARWLKALKAFN